MASHLLDKFDIFVFDWDGTLATLGPAYAINEKFSPFWKYKKNRYSMTKKDASKIKDYNIKTRMRERKIEGTLFARFVDTYFYLFKPKLQRGSLEVLKKLRRRHKRICLFTNGATWRIMRELSKLGIEDYFEIIVSAQEIKAIKPNPIGLETMIKKLRVKKVKVIYTGDMVDDIMMAKYAKVHSCAIAGGFSEYDKLESTMPDYLFKTMEEFEKAL